jgi:hypothetical protein
MDVSSVLRTLCSPSRLMSRLSVGRPLLRSVRRDEMFDGARLVVSAGLARSSWFVLERSADYEPIVFRADSSLESITEKVDAAIERIGERMGRALFRRTPARDCGGAEVAGLLSLDEWCPAKLTNERFCEVDRTVDPPRCAGQRVDVTGRSFTEAVVDVDAQGLLATGETTAPIYVSPKTFERGLSEMGSRSVAGQDTLAVVWTLAGGATRTVFVVRDPGCPDDVSWRVPAYAFTLFSLGSAPQLSTPDGITCIRRRSPDAEGDTEARLAMYAQTGLTAGADVVRIAGLGARQ